MTAETGKSRKREEAIAALLAHPTIASAAAAVGISEPTLLRWLKEKAFAAEYRAARRQALEVAIGLSQKASGAAMATTIGLMQDSKAAGSVRLAAARTVLDYAFKGVDLLDLKERVEALELAQEEQKG